MNWTAPLDSVKHGDEEKPERRRQEGWGVALGKWLEGDAAESTRQRGSSLIGCRTHKSWGLAGSFQLELLLHLLCGSIVDPRIRLWQRDLAIPLLMAIFCFQRR